MVCPPPSMIVEVTIAPDGRILEGPKKP